MRVLIVDDSERLRQALRSGLDSMGLAVDVAADGHAALAGLDLADLLASRRRAAEAAMAKVEARATAFIAAASLLLDTHAYWIDEDGHTAGDAHTTTHAQP